MDKKLSWLSLLYCDVATRGTKEGTNAAARKQLARHNHNAIPSFPLQHRNETCPRPLSLHLQVSYDQLLPLPTFSSLHSTKPVVVSLLDILYASLVYMIPRISDPHLNQSLRGPADIER
jgi:hypothetical protein